MREWRSESTRVETCPGSPASRSITQRSGAGGARVQFCGNGARYAERLPDEGVHAEGEPRGAGAGCRPCCSPRRPRGCARRRSRSEAGVCQLQCAAVGRPRHRLRLDAGGRWASGEQGWKCAAPPSELAPYRRYVAEHVLTTRVPSPSPFSVTSVFTKDGLQVPVTVIALMEGNIVTQARHAAARRPHGGAAS